MAPLEKAEKDMISAQVLQQLSQTRYACSSLTQLSSRPANFVYRGILAKPVTTEDGATVQSVIIKHSTDFVAIKQDSLPDVSRYILEESMLNSLIEFSSLATTTKVIKTPRLYLFDQETNTQVLEDFTNTLGFNSTLFSPNPDNLLPPPVQVIVGRHLGSWLRSFHTWALAPEQSAIRALMLQNEPVRKLKYELTYDGFLKVLENYPELLRGHKETLETIQYIIAKDFDTPPTEQDKNWGLIHGDFWSGNILLTPNPWRELGQSDVTKTLFIIDWEFAQFGHQSYDLGQIVGDLCERKIFNNIDTVIPVMEGVIDGYGKLSDEMAFRTAVYVGVHLIGWYNRRPQRIILMTPPEVIVTGLTVGRDFILKGWEQDRKYFEGSVLASLFSAR